jgi:hypothetical protein
MSISMGYVRRRDFAFKQLEITELVILLLPLFTASSGYHRRWLSFILFSWSAVQHILSFCPLLLAQKVLRNYWNETTGK